MLRVMSVENTGSCIVSHQRGSGSLAVAKAGSPGASLCQPAMAGGLGGKKFGPTVQPDASARATRPASRERFNHRLRRPIRWSRSRGKRLPPKC